VSGRLTDGVEFDSLLAEPLGAEDDLVLRLAVSDEHADLARLRTHSHVGLEVVLQDEVQGHSFKEKTHRLSEDTNTINPLDLGLYWSLDYSLDPRLYWTLDSASGLTCHGVASLVGQVGDGRQKSVPGRVLVQVPHGLGVSAVLSQTYGESTSASEGFITRWRFFRSSIRGGSDSILQIVAGVEVL